MYISPEVRLLITTKDDSVELFTSTFESTDNEELKDLYCKEIIEAFWPEVVTDEIARFCTPPGSNDWVPQYGDIDIKMFKLQNSIANDPEFDPEPFANEISYLWEDRRDKEIVRVLDILTNLGYKVPYLPYKRDPEFQSNYPKTLKNPSSKRVIKGIRTKYTIKQLESLYKYLEDNSYIEEARVEDFVKCFTAKPFSVEPRIQWLEDNMVFYALIKLMRPNFSISHYASPLMKNQIFLSKNGIPFKKDDITKNVNAYYDESKHFNEASSDLKKFFDEHGLSERHK